VDSRLGNRLPDRVLDLAAVAKAGPMTSDPSAVENAGRQRPMPNCACIHTGAATGRFSAPSLDPDELGFVGRRVLERSIQALGDRVEVE
jgi:hypothetical protein